MANPEEKSGQNEGVEGSLKDEFLKNRIFLSNRKLSEEDFERIDRERWDSNKLVVKYSYAIKEKLLKGVLRLVYPVIGFSVGVFLYIFYHHLMGDYSWWRISPPESIDYLERKLGWLITGGALTKLSGWVVNQKSLKPEPSESNVDKSGNSNHG